ncbi:hypothetical protein EJ082_07565 [Brevundimonas diminuta]|uniref:DUF5681 domain-containing protein n=1 Tax=Brevundimonas diminuta TaxID=293 RepID=UPI00168B20D6|nr:DUF5681 domain-containing protein [Brevundimonas diminuta]MBD3572826.1 hypothetical protein [Brevundimonas diminuta]
MSAHDDDDDWVGYRRPPKHTRFKKGQSGNPRGRPVKRPSADTPGEIGRVIREVSRMTVRGPQGEEVPMLQAQMMALANAGLKGKASAIKLFAELLASALEDNVARHPELKLIDEADLITVNRRPRSKAKLARTLKDLAKQSRKS